MRVLGTAFLPGHRSMNPCPVYDEFTGTIFLFFIAVLGHTSESYQLVTGKNVTRLCYISSTDNGDTWSPVTDLTKGVIGETIKVTPTGAAGVSGSPVPGPESVECQMVSVDEEDGTNMLYCNARSPLGYRVQALSLDDGAAFQEGQLVQRLVEPRNGCHGSVVGFPAPLHSCEHPDSGLRTAACLSPPARLFPRDPDSWRGPWVIYEGPSAYSDLAHLELPSPGEPPAVAFACLFECGTRTAYDQICFSIFTLYELIDNLPRRDQAAARDHKTQTDLGRVLWTRLTGARGEPSLQGASQGKRRRRKRKKLSDRCSVS
ncbi:unnamed protein product [Lampetra planeri]